mmetsp:Transcript_80068/g.226666  ORF Transcript_80068/g.226666 Transcript_80068/m.226666 type:complete len:473 (-) Transcript_80068:40-1458(-)
MLMAHRATTRTLTVATANVLSISKATMSPAGMAQFALDAHTKHNDVERDESTKEEYSKWMIEVLETLMLVKGVSLLALQEIDLPLFNAIKKFTRDQNSKKSGLPFQYHDINGHTNPAKHSEHPSPTDDSLYVVWRPPSPDWEFGCTKSEGVWTGNGNAGKTLGCNLRWKWNCTKSGLSLHGLFLHGDSKFKDMADVGPVLRDFPARRPDFIMGDFNMEKKSDIHAMLNAQWGQRGGNHYPFKITPTPEGESTVMRGEYKFRKIAQQFENAKGFMDIDVPCTCTAFKKHKPDLIPGVHKKANDALGKMCTTIKDKKLGIEGYMKEYNLGDMADETKDFDFRDWKAKWHLPTTDTPVELIAKGKTKYEISPLSTLGLATDGMVQTEEKVEDFIVVNEDTVHFDEKKMAEIYLYNKAKAASTDKKMPTAVWPSDHFPVIKTLNFRHKVRDFLKERITNKLKETVKKMVARLRLRF